MASPAQPPVIAEAFKLRPDLRKRLHAAIEETPQHLDLFCALSQHILDVQSSQQQGASHSASDEQQQAAKKRKLDTNIAVVGGGGNGAGAKGRWSDASVKPAFALPGTSFAVPQRKKLDLEVVADGIRATNSGTGTVEFGLGFRDIEHIFCLPVPEKAKRQDNFVCLPFHGSGIGPAPPAGVEVPEPLVWTVAEAPKSDQAAQEQDVGKVAAALNKGLQQAFGNNDKKVLFPSDDEFKSKIAQSHRKHETAYHVKAFKGSKEGFLFFLETGIIFAFKKPLLFFPFESIASISYTAVLQRTFNLLISTQSSASNGTTQHTAAAPEDGAGEGQEMEFAMIDQADYVPIDAYVKAHDLHDASMAAQRRAKRLNINPPEPSSQGQNGHGAGVGVGGEGAEEEEGMTELQKAEQQLQDEEDEMEEDFDPGSEGDSDGSGEGEGSEDEEEDIDQEEVEDVGAPADDNEEEVYDEEEEEEEEEEEHRQ